MKLHIKYEMQQQADDCNNAAASNNNVSRLNEMESTLNTVPATIKLYGNFANSFYCGYCGRALEAGEGATGNEVCSHCGALNLLPEIELCDCASCKAGIKAAQEATK